MGGRDARCTQSQSQALDCKGREGSVSMSSVGGENCCEEPRRPHQGELGNWSTKTEGGNR